MYGLLFTLICVILALGNAASTCENITSQSSCAASKCSWCTSGAVGASCMDPADAAGLPSSVFTCTTSVKNPYYFLSTSDCEGITSDSTCTSNSDCAWCTSGAVGSSCMDATDAHGLPASVFSCTYGKSAVATATVSAPSPSIPDVPASERWWMGDVEYGRTRATPSAQTEVHAGALGASASSYKSDPYGYMSLYLSEYAYCDPTMNVNFNTNQYTNGFVKTLSFSSGSKDSITGFIGYMPSSKAIVVSFRGSENIQNWITNLSFIRKDYPNCAGCSVHQGFYQAEQGVLPQITAELSKLNAKYSSYKIIVTGHSLGAALATLTALDLAPIYGGNRVKVYNYGCPRIFNQAGADYASSGVVIIGARRTHYKDIVPHTPPEVMGFVHTAGEIYENGPSNNYPAFPGGPLADCNGEEDKNCADQYDGASVSDHLLYSGLTMGTGGCSIAQ